MTFDRVEARLEGAELVLTHPAGCATSVRVRVLVEDTAGAQRVLGTGAVAALPQVAVPAGGSVRCALTSV